MDGNYFQSRWIEINRLGLAPNDEHLVGSVPVSTIKQTEHDPLLHFTNQAVYFDNSPEREVMRSPYDRVKIYIDNRYRSSFQSIILNNGDNCYFFSVDESNLDWWFDIYILSLIHI